MPTATPETIRDRIITLISALTPTSLAADKFRVARDEAAADFRGWAEQNPAACLRRFQVRYDGNAEPPEVTNLDVAQLRMRVRILIAYPQTHRFGGAAGRDRDDVIDEDWRKLDYSVGIYGRANFSGTNDCTPMGCQREIERGQGVDFLTITAEYIYTLDVDA